MFRRMQVVGPEGVSTGLSLRGSRAVQGGGHEAVTVSLRTEELM